MIQSIILQGLFFIMSILITACGMTPYTERSQLILIPTCVEEAMGSQLTSSLLEKEKIEKDSKFLQKVNEIGKRIVAVLPESEYEWEWRFYTIDSDTINAFAVPGGSVFVYKGILQVVKTEEQLAAIMGHEITHVILRHGTERMSQALLLQIGGQLGAAAIDKYGKESHVELFSQVYGATATLGVLLPYSRKHEYEADHVGVLLMADAGYDPKEAIKLWENFASLENKKSIPEFLSTHPVDENRILALEKIMPEAMIRFEKSGGKPGPTPLKKI